MRIERLARSRGGTPIQNIDTVLASTELGITVSSEPKHASWHRGGWVTCRIGSGKARLLSPMRRGTCHQSFEGLLSA
jgi:hypothetical protein